jgi:hypothetical protein
MPSGKSARGTTWRPIEAATTPWVTNLKLPATKLSKNITTPQSLLQAISVPTNCNNPPCQPFPTPNLPATNEFSNRNLLHKTLPRVWNLLPGWAVSYSTYDPKTRASSNFGKYYLTYTVVVITRNSHALTPGVPPNSVG